MIEPALALCMADRVRMSADHVSKRVIQLSDKKACIRKFVNGMTSKESRMVSFRTWAF